MEEFFKCLLLIYVLVKVLEVVANVLIEAFKYYQDLQN